METEYFYFTITDTHSKHNAHKLNETLNFNSIKAWNKGEEVEANYIATHNFLRYLPEYDTTAIEYMFNRHYVSQWLQLPKDLKHTLHFVANGSWSKYAYGHVLTEEVLKKLALLNANFIFHAQLHHPKVNHDYPCVEYRPCDETTHKFQNDASLMIYSHHHSVDDISHKIGLEPNDRCYTVGDTIGNNTNSNHKHPVSRRKRRFTLWQYKVSCHEQGKNVAQKQNMTANLNKLVDELYAIKEKILSLNNDIDLDMSITLRGDMPDSCEFEITQATIGKLAKMGLPLDLSMYFFSNG